MIKVFGGTPGTHSPFLHGRKGHSWVHVGPLDGPVSVSQVWQIAREALRTDTKSVTILSADFDTLAASDKDKIKTDLGVTITIRVIPASAIDEVKRRLELERAGGGAYLESMAIPAFYAPLSIVLGCEVVGRVANVRLERCEIDIESFLASQRPILKPLTDAMSAATRKKAQAELEKWEDRRKELERWLEKATSWQKFIDFWAIDWDYGGRQRSDDDKPIFVTDWQSFRSRRSKNDVDQILFGASFRYDTPGQHLIAARVTDVFGNDGIATVTVDIQ